MRRLLGAAMALALVLAAAPPASAAPSSDQVLVPSGVSSPWLWQTRLAADPPGRAMAAFSTEFVPGAEWTGVVVGRDGAFRTFDLNPGDQLGALSPDGRLLAGNGELLDLESGAVRQSYPWMYRPSWSAESRLFVGHVPGGPALRVVDVAAGAAREVRLPEEPTTFAPTVSPDGRLAAVGLRSGALLVVDLVTGRELLRTPLAAGEHVGGEAPWSADGRLAIIAMDEAAPSFSVRYVDAATGAPRGAPTGPHPGAWAEAVGWRHGTDLVVRTRSGNRDEGEVRLVVLPADGSRQVVLDRTSVDDLQVARELVESGRFGGPRAVPWPFDLATGCSILAVLALLLLAWSVTRLLRRRRTVAGAAPAA